MKFTEGQIINNRYELNRLIGFGSFGEVWLAKDQILDMDVAIKIYVALDSRGLKEFKNEFRTAYSLHHPNLLRADYFDSIDKNPYLIMPYCPESAADKTGQMDEDDIWHFIYDVSCGLEYLHNNDVIHRDIKPDNILRDEHGIYVITDFGLSTKMRSTLRKASVMQNDTNKSAGTIGYMAPEMFASSPQSVKATDIWALGATLFELATGEMPFCGQGGVMESYGAELPDMPTVQSHELVELIHKCLAKDPWDRPTAVNIKEIASSQLGLSEPGQKADVDKYSKQIQKLKNEIVKIKEEKGLNKNSRRHVIFCWILLTLLLGSIGTSIYLHNINELQSYEIWQVNNSLSSANTLINTIQGLIDTHSASNEETFLDWKSKNHENNSTGSQYYELEAKIGDKFSFDYDVDTESCDHFICYLVHNGEETEIKNIAGRDQRGIVRHTFQDDGSYTIKLLYNKDYSVNSGRDNVIVTNIKLEKCIEGKIKNLLRQYKLSEVNIFEEADTICLDTSFDESLDSVFVE